MKGVTSILLLLCLSLGTSLADANRPALSPAMMRELPTAHDTEALLVDSEPNPIYIPPPPLLDPGTVTASAVQALAINVNYNPNDNAAQCDVAVLPWPAEAQTALGYALRIWSSLLNGNVPLAIDVCWTAAMEPNVLANSRAAAKVADFPGAPQSNTRYPVALANQLSDSDRNGAAAEMRIKFNANQPWYFGTDGRVPAGQTDFVSVALHEVGHALGFDGSMNWDDGTGDNECRGIRGLGCYGNPPEIYDRFARNTSGQALLSFSSDTQTLGSQLIITNNLVFGGPNATATNGGMAPFLFTPATWNAGSSYSHLDEDTFDRTHNALMTPSLAAQEAIHHPGEVALGILRDLGWRIRDLAITFVNASNTAEEDGSALRPFNTAEEGVNAVASGGTVIFAAGNYPGRLTIMRPMVLKSPGGTTVLGAKP